MKFEDAKAGNSLKDRKLRSKLKECVRISARAKRFPLKKGKSTVMADFLLILSHVITVHKSQGSALTYIQGDLNWSTGKKTATGKNYQQSNCQCQFYMLLSCAKSHYKMLLVDFEPEDTKVNKSALEEMVRLRNESLFSRQHSLIELDGISMCLRNIR